MAIRRELIDELIATSGQPDRLGWAGECFGRQALAYFDGGGVRERCPIRRFFPGILNQDFVQLLAQLALRERGEGTEKVASCGIAWAEFQPQSRRRQRSD